MTTTNDIKNHLANQGSNVIGALVMWTLGGFTVPRDTFRDAMADFALDGAVGRDPKAITLARAAIAAARTGRKNTLIRQITADEHKTVWGIVAESKDAAAVKVEHEQVSRIALFPATGALALEDEDNQVAIAVRDAYVLRRDHMLTADVSKVVISAITGPMMGLRLAGRGGAYFVRAKHIPTLRRLGAYLEATGSDSLFTILEITGEGQNLQQAGKRAHLELSARVRDVLTEARDFIGELKAKADPGEPVPARVMKTRMKRFREIRDASQLYADVLGDLRGKLEEQIADARRQVLGLDAPLEGTFEPTSGDEKSEAAVDAIADTVADVGLIDFGSPDMMSTEEELDAACAEADALASSALTDAEDELDMNEMENDADMALGHVDELDAADFG
jgi:hypothetical protein